MRLVKTVFLAFSVNLLILSAAFAETTPPVVPATPGVTTATTSYADLSEKLLPAVVNISTTQKITITKRGDQGQGDDNLQDMLPQFPPGSPFEQFFKDFLERHNNQNAAPRRTASLGSGFIIDAKQGYVITNNHVIEDGEEINVILQDDTILKAKLIGTDTKTDLAVLKVETKKPLSNVSWGDSDMMRVGDPVLAIGNPFGLGGTVTAGIISARARNINAGPYDDFLQTDASINRGNSGGPMFNMKGEVIGINTAIFSPSGGSVGIGFAIPSNLATSVVKQIIEYGHTRRGWLGVRIQEVTDEIAEGLGLDKARGALVAGVTPGGPAEKAGLQPGDVIVKFDGKEVGQMRRLPRIVADTAINKSVDVDILRKGTPMKKTVILGELETAEKAEADNSETKQAEPSLPQNTVKALGMSLVPLTPETARQFSLRDGQKGVVVAAVEGTSRAAEKGITAGDVVTEVNQQSVNEPSQLEAKINDARKAGRRSVLLLVESKGDLRFVALSLEEKENKK